MLAAVSTVEAQPTTQTGEAQPVIAGPSAASGAGTT